MQENSPAKNAEQEEEVIRLMEALTQLPEDQRISVVLKYWENLTIEKIAGYMGKTPSSVKGILDQGCSALRKILRNHSSLLGNIGIQGACLEKINAAAQKLVNVFQDDEQKIIKWIWEHNGEWPRAKQIAELISLPSEEAARKWKQRHKTLWQEFQQKLKRHLEEEGER